MSDRRLWIAKLLMSRRQSARECMEDSKLPMINLSPPDVALFQRPPWASACRVANNSVV
jgi:hypothetical protein